MYKGCSIAWTARPQEHHQHREKKNLTAELKVALKDCVKTDEFEALTGEPLHETEKKLRTKNKLDSNTLHLSCEANLGTKNSIPLSYNNITKLPHLKIQITWMKTSTPLQHTYRSHRGRFTCTTLHHQRSQHSATSRRKYNLLKCTFDAKKYSMIIGSDIYLAIVVERIHITFLRSNRI